MALYHRRLGVDGASGAQRATTAFSGDLEIQALAACDSGVLGIAGDGRILFANPAANLLFQMPILGVRASDLMPGIAAMIDPKSQDYAVGRGLRESLGVNADGIGFPIMISVNGALWRGEPLLVATLRDFSLLKTQHQELEHQALHDALTGLPNRLLFADRLGSALSAARRLKEKVAVLLLDLDGFKEVNDTLGHHVGDLLLVEIAQRLASPIRECDTVARLGGDEFAVLLPAMADQEAAIAGAERLLAEIVKPVTVLNGLRLEVGASVGIALYPTHGKTPAKLQQCADIAMYAAKSGPKVMVYDPERNAGDLRHLSMAAALRDAVEHDHISMAWQPQLDLRSNHICAVEILARWHHPRLGVIEPGDFIPQAERLGLLPILTRSAVVRALDRIDDWRRRGWALEVAINLAPRTLHDRALLDLITAMVRERGVDPGNLILEITESAIVIDPERAFAHARRLADAGFKLAIDDFGTGYSSLGLLRKLPLAALKIDRGFVIDMLSADGDAAIVRVVIDLAHHFGMAVIAEGVESAAHIEKLRDLGCDRVQGYHIAPPLDAAAFDAWLEAIDPRIA